MYLRRVEIRDFRKITHRIVEGLDDGLNVVVGDNEAGKSTLLAALRAVFFERHTLSGLPVDAMLPYGSVVRPEITVDFDLGSASWRLRKAFKQRPEAELTGPGVRLTGTAVEDRLVDLLGFTPPGRGGAKPEEHHGTHGLLWVEQGTRESLGVGAGRDTLAGALEREVGQVTGGERGRHLLAAAAERRDRFWTKTDRPRGDLRELGEEIERLEGEHVILRQRQQLTETKIARLAEIAGVLHRHRRDDRLNQAAVAARAARARLAEAEALDGKLLAATNRFREAERECAVAAERCQRRAALAATAASARAEAEAAATRSAEADALARHGEARAQAVDETLRTLRQARGAAEDHSRALDEALRRREAEALVARHKEQVNLAERQEEARRAAVARAGLHGIDKEAIANLARLEKNAEAARAELNAARVQLSFAPAGSQSILVDDVPHASEGPLALGRDTVLDLEGFGRVTIRPGGGTAELLRRAERADRALGDELARAGMASVAEARLALERKTAAQTEAASLASAVAALAPGGLEALRQTLDIEAMRLSQPLSPQAADLAPIASPGALDQARNAAIAARNQVEAAERDAKAAGDVRQAALLEAARTSERLAAAQRARGAIATDLNRARSETDDDLLNARLDSASAAVADAREAELAARTAFEAADAESARLSLERAERAEREIKADIESLDREQRDIRAELRGGGQDGLGERLAEIEGLIDTRQKKLAALGLEAEAARMLHDALNEAQRDAKDRWLAPVRSRVSPYLRLLAPGSEIDVDEQTLELKGLRRNGVAEPFLALSMGAREQIAVVTRLALADVLRDAGHPAAVILDDALVNTDEARLERMHNVLTRAARGLQILVLTCRERDFIGLGKVHRI